LVSRDSSGELHVPLNMTSRIWKKVNWADPPKLRRAAEQARSLNDVGNPFS
jgi:hypothetical protein